MLNTLSFQNIPIHNCQVGQNVRNRIKLPINQLTSQQSRQSECKCQNQCSEGQNIAYDCQLIAIYPQNQSNAQNITIEENSKNDDDKVKQQACLDIQSIINSFSHQYFPLPQQNDKIIFKEKQRSKNFEKSKFLGRNQTKNIPKNYIKAVFSFILQNPTTIKKMFTKRRTDLQNCNINDFLQFISAQKKITVYTIERLKKIWLDESYGKVMRIIYAYFLRKKSLQYIYSSRIENKLSHVRHRLKIFKSLSEPQEFRNIK